MSIFMTMDYKISPTFQNKEQFILSKGTLSIKLSRFSQTLSSSSLSSANETGELCFQLLEST
jgi:hypothetical protein